MSRRERGTGEREASFGRWMAAAQDGDAAAYEALLRELMPVLRVFVGARIRDAAAAEDVVQNVLLSLHRARHTYQPGRPFGPWLRAIARNAVADSLRQRGRRGERETVLPDADQIPDLRERTNPDAPLSAWMVEALEALTPAQREAVLLIQVQELSVREAAERAGVTVATLKVRAHRGYKALRERLGRRPLDD